MKFIVSVILTAALSFAACLYLPWWIIAVTAFIVALFIPQSAGKAFIAGFLALFILWSGLAWWISNANGNLFAHKISMLFIKTDSPVLIILFTGLIGALVAGLGSLTGSLLRNPAKRV